MHAKIRRTFQGHPGVQQGNEGQPRARENYQKRFEHREKP